MDQQTAGTVFCVAAQYLNVGILREIKISDNFWKQSVKPDRVSTVAVCVAKTLNETIRSPPIILYVIFLQNNQIGQNLLGIVCGPHISENLRTIDAVPCLKS